MAAEPSFTIRTATLDDAAAFARVQNACSLSEVGFETVTEEDARWWFEAQDLAFDEDFWAAVDADGEVIGYSTISSTAPEDMWTHVFVHPDHNGLGAGSALLERTMARADELGEMAKPKTGLYQRIWRWTAHEKPHAIFVSHGFSQCRLFFTMELALDAPPQEGSLPEGIAIRPFEVGRDEHAVHDTFVETFAEHWGMTPVGYDLFKHFVYDRENFDPGLLLVAVERSELVGYCQSSPKEAVGPEAVEVHGLGVHKRWRQRGIGLALLRRSFAAMYERGLTDVVLDVEGDNPTGAVALYEKAGMNLRAESVIYERKLR